MSARHTQGQLAVQPDSHPWTPSRDDTGSSCWMGLVDEQGEVVAIVVAHHPDPWHEPDGPEANASRLKACWNACLPISDPENVVPRLLSLNERVPDLEAEAAAHRVQRDKLLEVLKEARRWIGDGECGDGLAREYWTPEYGKVVDGIDAAIAEMTGDQAAVPVQEKGPPITDEQIARMTAMAYNPDGEGVDPLIDRARGLVVTSGKASISYVQRHLKVGYNRAARLLEALEIEGTVSPMYSSGVRDVLAKGGAA